MAIRATFAARETAHASKALVRVLHSQAVFEHDRTNCMRHFDISHYFAELDQMHMLSTVFGWCKGRGPHISNSRFGFVVARTQSYLPERDADFEQVLVSTASR